MYFTENRYDRSIESMMKGIPNFYPRGSGIVVTGRFEYTADIFFYLLCKKLECTLTVGIFTNIINQVCFYVF